MTKEEMKEWIDNASYEALLRKWRFEPMGSPWFEPPLRKYFGDVMFEKKKTADHVQASKNVGWAP